MPKEQVPGKPTSRRYSPEEKAAAVRMVRTLRAELGTEHGTVHRVARRPGTGLSRCAHGSARPISMTGTRPGCPPRSPSDKDLEQENRELKRANEIQVDANRDEFGVEPICTVLRSAGVQVAPSTYYANKTRTPSARAQRYR